MASDNEPPELTAEAQAEEDVLMGDLALRTRFVQRYLPTGGVGAEIGVLKGRFSRILWQETRPSRLHLMDPWYLAGAEWEYQIPNRSTVDALIGVLRQFRDELPSGAVQLHIGFDLDLLPGFPDHYFDWVYLDTTHKYDQTRDELQILKHKLKPNGILAGDDWHAEPEHVHYGVCVALREFVASEPWEFLYAGEEWDLQWALRRR